jgi:hypothetical protein
MKNIKYKMTFEVTCNFKDLMDEKTFQKEYKGDLFKLCRWMCKNEGICGWFDEQFKLVKAEFINKK